MEKVVEAIESKLNGVKVKKELVVKIPNDGCLLNLEVYAVRVGEFLVLAYKWPDGITVERFTNFFIKESSFALLVMESFLFCKC